MSDREWWGLGQLESPDVPDVIQRTLGSGPQADCQPLLTALQLPKLFSMWFP